MPTYEYECKSCNHQFEVFQNMSDPPLKTCPKCGKRVRRLIGGGAGVIFKGSGFYVTDNKKNSAAAAKKSADTETKPKTEAASASTEKTEKASSSKEKKETPAAAKTSA